MTVMFVDLVGSTAMAEHHEPEAVRDVLERYQDLSERAITAHRGTISDYIGDGIMAYFGFPEAREDDARQAVLAGLELVGSLEAVAAQLLREQGMELSARVGIHTGVVLVSDMGTDDEKRRETIIGTTPNQAARIQTFAPPGTVAISDDTLEIVRGFFSVESLGRPAMKGIDREVEVFRVLGPTAAVHRLQAEGSFATRLVDRDGERQILRERWDSLLTEPRSDAPGRVVVIRGEAGIGKSRLADSLVTDALSVGDTVLTAFCAPDRQASRLYPVAGMFERAFELPTGDDDASRAEAGGRVREARRARPGHGAVPRRRHRTRRRRRRPRPARARAARAARAHVRCASPRSCTREARPRAHAPPRGRPAMGGPDHARAGSRASPRSSARFRS